MKKKNWQARRKQHTKSGRRKKNRQLKETYRHVLSFCFCFCCSLFIFCKSTYFSACHKKKKKKSEERVAKEGKKKKKR